MGHEYISVGRGFDEGTGSPGINVQHCWLVQACNSSTFEKQRQEAQKFKGHLQLHSKFKACLGYMRPSLRGKGQWWHQALTYPADTHNEGPRAELYWEASVHAFWRWYLPHVNNVRNALGLKSHGLLTRHTQDSNTTFHFMWKYIMLNARWSHGYKQQGF